LFMPWQAFVLIGTLHNAVCAHMGVYICFVVCTAYFQAARMALDVDVLFWEAKSLLLGILVIIDPLYIISLVGTLYTDLRWWNAWRYIANTLAIILIGAYLLPKLVKLRRLILETNKNIGKRDTLSAVRGKMRRPDRKKKEIEMADSSEEKETKVNSFIASIESETSIWVREREDGSYVLLESSTSSNGVHSKQPSMSKDQQYVHSPPAIPKVSGKNKMTRKLLHLTCFFTLGLTAAIAYTIVAVISNFTANESYSSNYRSDGATFEKHYSQWVLLILPIGLTLYTAPASNRIRIKCLQCCFINQGE